MAFLIGFSFTFEQPLLQAGLPIRHIECGCNVPMYRTNRLTTLAGRFAGSQVVSMRPVPAELVPLAVTVTARFPAVHGAPVHVGAPETLGIADLSKPDWGDPVPIHPVPGGRLRFKLVSREEAHLLHRLATDHLTMLLDYCR